MKLWFLTWNGAPVAIVNSGRDFVINNPNTMFKGKLLIDFVEFFTTPKEALEQVVIHNLFEGSGLYEAEALEI